MSNLFVVGFDEPHKAEEVSLKLQELQGEYLLDLEEVIVAIKDQKGKVKLRQAGSLLTSDDVVFTGFCGSLTSLIFLNAMTGAGSGALADVGITDQFMKELAGTLIPGGSALFVLVRRPSPDRERVLKELNGIGGKILKTSVSHEDAAKLQAALSAARSKVLASVASRPLRTSPVFQKVRCNVVQVIAGVALTFRKWPRCGGRARPADR